MKKYPPFCPVLESNSRRPPGSLDLWTPRRLPGSLASSSSSPSPFAPKGWHSRNYLSHFDAGPAVQHINYRLADALPKHALSAMQAQCDVLQLTDPEKADALRQRVETYLDAGHGSCLLQYPELAKMIVDNWLYFDQERYRLLAWMVMPNHVHVLIEPLGGWSVPKIVATWKAYSGRRIRDWLVGRGEKAEEGKSQAGAWRSEEESCQAGAWRSKEGRGHGSAWRSEEEIAQFRFLFERHGRVWQREYWDRFIRNSEHYWWVKAYIENNPVKAGLVSEAELWPWSSAADRQEVYAPW